MSDVQKMGFGVVNDTDNSLKGKSGGGKFGLNKGVISKLEYISDAGKDKTPGDAVDIIFSIGERNYNRRIFDVTRVYGKDGELTDTTSAEYIKIYNTTLTQTLAVIIHAVKALGVTQEQIEGALRTPPASFAEWAKVITGLVAPGYETKPVDGFLEYQWNVQGENDRTYLEVPKNMKGGYFLMPSVDPMGTWNEVNTWVEKDKDNIEVTCTGLAYIDEAKNIHPFTRSQNYMESNKAIQQIEGQANPTGMAASPATAPKATW